MANCSKCGTPLTEGARFCPECGLSISETPTLKVNESVKKVFQTEDKTASFPLEETKGVNKFMALLAYAAPLMFIPLFTVYIGLLVLIPILAVPNSKYVRFHANQGLILLFGCIAYSICASLLSSLFGFVLGLLPFFAVIAWLPALISAFIYLVGFILLVIPAIFGFISAANGKAKRMPVIGGIDLLK